MKYKTKNIEVVKIDEKTHNVSIMVGKEKYSIHKNLFDCLFEKINVLPDWVKVGNYAYFDEKYHKITSIATEGYSTPRISFDSVEHISFGSLAWNKVAEARVRPWENDELPYQVGKVFQRLGVTLLCCGSMDNELIFVKGNTYSTVELLQKDCRLIDGSPCGVFEHLEYDPIDECYDWVM